MIHARLLAPARALLPVVAAALLAACAGDAAPAAQLPAGDTAAAAAAGQPAVIVAAPERAGAPARVVVNGVDLTGVGHDVGDPRAPIVMVELSDFGCPYCAKHALETFPVLEREFIAPGKVFYKHVPFVLGMFPNGDRAASAAECAGEQGRFWPMHDSVYARQTDWKRGDDPDGVLRAAARAVVPDVARWSACYDANGQRARTQAATAAAQRLRVRATPTFFINGQMVEGALPLPVMRGGLNAMLREIGAR